MAVRHMRDFPPKYATLSHLILWKICKFMFSKITNIMTLFVRNEVNRVLKCVHSINRAHRQLKKVFLSASLH